MSMSEMSAFQRRFLNRAEAVDLFTQEEFDKEMKAKISVWVDLQSKTIN